MLKTSINGLFKVKLQHRTLTNLSKEVFVSADSYTEVEQILINSKYNPFTYHIINIEKTNNESISFIDNSEAYTSLEEKKKLLTLIECLLDTARNNTELENIYNDTEKANGDSVSWLEASKEYEKLRKWTDNAPDKLNLEIN